MRSKIDGRITEVGEAKINHIILLQAGPDSVFSELFPLSSLECVNAPLLPKLICNNHLALEPQKSVNIVTAFNSLTAHSVCSGLLVFFHFGEWIVFLGMSIVSGYSFCPCPTLPAHLSLDL